MHPFDIKSVDLIAQWTKRRAFADAAHYNRTGAALSTFPVLITGVLAWYFQLEGQKIKGILLQHIVLASLATVITGLRGGSTSGPVGANSHCPIFVSRSR